MFFIFKKSLFINIKNNFQCKFFVDNGIIIQDFFLGIKQLIET